MATALVGDMCAAVGGMSISGREIQNASRKTAPMPFSHKISI
jgi:hypothetical protein